MIGSVDVVVHPTQLSGLGTSRLPPGLYNDEKPDESCSWCCGGCTAIDDDVDDDDEQVSFALKGE